MERNCNGEPHAGSRQNLEPPAGCCRHDRQIRVTPAFYAMECKGGWNKDSFEIRRAKRTEIICPDVVSTKLRAATLAAPSRWFSLAVQVTQCTSG